MKPSLLLLAALSLSATAVQAAPIPSNVFRDRCKNLAALYNAAAGKRSVTFGFKNYQGGDVTATADMQFESDDGSCVSNPTSATIRLKRLNNVLLHVRVTFSGDGTNHMVVADVFSDCGDIYPDYLVTKLQQTGVQINDAFKTYVTENARKDFCPAFTTAVQKDLEAVLGQ